MKKLIITVVLTIILSSCASGTFKYTEPVPPTEIPNTCVVNKNINMVWKDTINYLGNTAYVIDNIAKDSYIITLSFTENKTDKYVNCGSCEFSVEGFRIDENHNFNSNSPYTEYKTYDENSKRILHIERRMKLTGKINVTLMNLGENKTRIKVGVTYFVLKDGEFYRLSILYPENMYYMGKYESKLYFTTYSNDKDKSKMVCYPSFKLEKDILMDIVKISE